MSDNVPFEIQEEIIKRLPVKSLIRFRSVSKSWKSLIDSSNFITHYRLLLWAYGLEVLLCYSWNSRG
ncbi:putative F-box domain-containing protein [Helianthus annuus]|nr:putative F-box domain-containing protein [Helianthus annuus]